MPEQPSETQQPDGRARLTRALRRRSRGQAVAAALLALLGFAAVTQVKANGKDDQYVGARQGDLVQYINNLSLASQRTESEIAQLERTRASLQDATESRRTALELAREKADTLGLLAGTVPAQGPGIRVEVTDTGKGVGPDQLLNGLQELRDAGAEVIEFNDRVRAVAQTAITETPTGEVRVDGTPLRTPYVIEAIGDPHTLSDALTIPEGFTEGVRKVGGKVSVRQVDQVKVTSVVQPADTQWARPAPTR